MGENSATDSLSLAATPSASLYVGIIALESVEVVKVTVAPRLRKCGYAAACS